MQRGPEPRKVGSKPGAPCASFSRTHLIALLMALCVTLGRHFQHRWASGPVQPAGQSGLRLLLTDLSLQTDLQHRRLYPKEVLVNFQQAGPTGACHKILADTWLRP